MTMMALPHDRYQMIANFKQVVKDGDLRLHPIVTKLVDSETLEKMGASRMSEGDS